MRRFWVAVVLAALFASVPIPASAQTVIGAKSGVINWVEGNVFLGDQPYVMQPSQFGEVKEGMVFRTEDGRAEILLPPGVFFRVAENTSFKMISNRLIDTRVELLKGSGIVEIDDLAKEATVTLVAKDATISLNKAGLYRIDNDPAQLKVFKGTAEVEMNGQKLAVSAGKMAPLTGAVASAAKFNTENTDSFDNWSRRRGEVLADANISAAKQARGYPGAGGINPCVGVGVGGVGIGGIGGGYGGLGPFARPWGTWDYNPYYGLGTYVPCQGSVMSPYGLYYWSPPMVYGAFFSPNPIYVFNNRGLTGSPAGYTSPGNRGIGGAAPVGSSGGVGGVQRGGGGMGGGGGASAGAGHGGGGGRK